MALDKISVNKTVYSFKGSLVQHLSLLLAGGDDVIGVVSNFFSSRLWLSFGDADLQ